MGDSFGSYSGCRPGQTLKYLLHLWSLLSLGYSYSKRTLLPCIILISSPLHILLSTVQQSRFWIVPFFEMSRTDGCSNSPIVVFPFLLLFAGSCFWCHPNGINFTAWMFFASWQCIVCEPIVDDECPMQNCYKYTHIICIYIELCLELCINGNICPQIAKNVWLKHAII